MEIKQIRPEHKMILDKIRELYVESGGKPLYNQEDLGLNKCEKSIEGIEISFDYGVPIRMLTPDGYCMILGSSICGDLKEFWNFFIEEFDTTIIVPKRDDSKTHYMAYQTMYSGPIVRIK
jgi:hypothetical protein